MNYTLTERWLILANIPLAELKQRHQKAWARTKRYPFPIRTVYPIIIWFMNWFGPLIVLGSFRRATKLSEEKFGQFIVAWKQHSNTYIRGLEMLAFFSMKEVLTDDKPFETDFVHPLETIDK